MPRRAEPEGIRQALKGGASVCWLALCGPASCSNLYLIKYMALNYVRGDRDMVCVIDGLFLLS